MYVDNEHYGDVSPPASGSFHGDAGGLQPASRLWLRGSTMAPFDQMVIA